MNKYFKSFKTLVSIMNQEGEAFFAGVNGWHKFSLLPNGKINLSSFIHERQEYFGSAARIMPFSVASVIDNKELIEAIDKLLEQGCSDDLDKVVGEQMF